MTTKRRSFPRDPQATQERLLRTAERVFTEKGYDLARVDEIAEQAQVNKRMLYVYFTDKEGLYMAILERGFCRLLASMQEVAAQQMEPRSHTEELIRSFFQYLADHPSFVRLVAWESLRYGRHAGRVLAKNFRAALEKVFAVLQRGVDEGYFRADLDVHDLTASVYGLCLSHFSQREFLTILSEKDSDSPEARETALNHILRLVFDGIDQRPRSSSNRPTIRSSNAPRR
jgi:TetR/AcrR family transcriptional regulator